MKACKKENKKNESQFSENERNREIKNLYEKKIPKECTG